MGDISTGGNQWGGGGVWGYNQDLYMKFHEACESIWTICMVPTEIQKQNSMIFHDFSMINNVISMII